MTAEQLIQQARESAANLYPHEPEQRAQHEAEMLRRYLREVMRDREK